MERLAEKISFKIAEEISCSEEKREVIEYGIFAILQTFLIGLVVLAPAYFLGIFPQTASFFISVSLLRKFSGGVHSSSVFSCTVISIVSCLIFGHFSYLLSIILSDMIYPVIFGLSVYLFSLPVIFLKVPVESPNKPISNPLFKKALKIKSIILLSLYIIFGVLIVVLTDNNLTASGIFYGIILAVIWQTFSLTYIGQKFLLKSDRIIYEILIMKGGHNNEKN